MTVGCVLDLPEELIVWILLNIINLEADSFYVASTCHRLRRLVDEVVELNSNTVAEIVSAMPVPLVCRDEKRTIRRVTALSSVFSSPTRFVVAKKLARDTRHPLSAHLDYRAFTKRAAEQYLVAVQRVTCDEIGGYRLSGVAIDGMLKTAPIGMIQAAFFEVMGQSPRCVAVDFAMYHHRALVAYASKHERIDVLSLLVSDVAVHCSFEMQPGLTPHLVEMLQDLGSRPSRFWVRHRELIMFLLCTAIRNGKKSVVDSIMAGPRMVHAGALWALRATPD